MVDKAFSFLHSSLPRRYAAVDYGLVVQMRENGVLKEVVVLLVYQYSFFLQQGPQLLFAIWSVLYAVF